MLQGSLASLPLDAAAGQEAPGSADNHASQSLMLAIGGRGAFRRFKNQLYERHPDLIAPWHAFRDACAQRRSVEWLCDQQLISDEDAQQFAARHPDPDIP